MQRLEKNLYIPLYENRKYQSKMCTNRSTKKTNKNDQITHYLEHRGTGLETGRTLNSAASPHT